MSADINENELLKMHIAEVLKAARKESGLTQEKLAEMLGVERSSVAKYESGAATPTLVSLPNICKALNVSIDELLNIS